MKQLKNILYLCLVTLMVFTCAEDDDNADFINTAKAPSNVEVSFDVTQDNTGLVTIMPTAEGAVSFEVVFGDASENEQLPNGEFAEHIYAEGTYNVSVIAKGVTGLTAEISQQLVVSFTAPQNLEVTIENDLAVSKQVNVTATAEYAITYDVYFGEAGNDESVSGNIGETVSYVYQEAGTYTITVVAMGAAIETTTYTQEFEVTEILQPITSAPEQPARNEEDYISIFSGAYVDIEGTDYNPDWGQSGQGSSYAMFSLNGDDMLQYINLSYQGVQFGETVNASQMEYLHIDVWTNDVSQIQIFPISIATGEQLVTQDLVADEWNSFDIPISAFTDQGLSMEDIHQFKFVGEPWAAGTVFIDNLYFWKGASLPTEPITAAPTPTTPEANVISLFSDAYTNITVNEWNPGWGQTTTLSTIMIEGNNTLQYDMLNYTGIVTDYGNPTNASGMTHVHFDYWSPDATSLGLKLVNTSYGDGDPLKEDIEFVAAVTNGSWVSVDMLLSDYTTDVSGITQLLFESSSATVFIDNLYFYN